MKVKDAIQYLYIQSTHENDWNAIQTINQYIGWLEGKLYAQNNIYTSIDDIEQQFEKENI